MQWNMQKKCQSNWTHDTFMQINFHCFGCTFSVIENIKSFAWTFSLTSIMLNRHWWQAQTESHWCESNKYIVLYSTAMQMHTLIKTNHREQKIFMHVNQRSHQCDVSFACLWNIIIINMITADFIFVWSNCVSVVTFMANVYRSFNWFWFFVVVTVDYFNSLSR